MVELAGLGRECEVGAHAPSCELPDALALLTAVGAGIEVLGAVVAAGLEQPDKEEVVLEPLGPEPQILVVATDLLVIEVNVEELALPQGLGHALIEAQAGHGLVGNLRVEPDHLGMLEHLNEGHRVTDGRQEGVAARLVRLRLDREAQVVALVLGVSAQEVEGLLEPVERIARLLARGALDALTAAPEHIRRSAELSSHVDVAHGLLDRHPTHRTVVRREGAVLEHRMPEQVGRRHRADDAGLVEALLESIKLGATLGFGSPEGHEVVVVEAHPPRTDLGKAPDEVDGIDRRPGCVAEGIAPQVADRP